jgi:hypothetical protein
MPMDERTKATVRALLDRHPRGYVAEETGLARPRVSKARPSSGAPRR